ncbi:MAG: AEC family transporter [Synergistaceae bacterium]|jgi:predicted permease|nr:AEC family transporter [Synergistaceae bacterium]
MKGIFIIAPLILVIILGMAVRAAGFFTDKDKDMLTRLLYWIVLPALLFRTTYLAGGDISGQKNLFFSAYAAMIGLPLAAFLIAKFITHRGNIGQQALSAMAAARSNNIYLGLPACALAMGDAGTHAASVCLALALPGYNLISITWGEAVYSGGITFKSLRGIALRVVKNPLIISSVLGICAAALKIPMPETLMSSIKLVADMATGVALLSLGMSLELSLLIPALKHAWHDALIKLALHPAITWIFLMLWPVHQDFFRAAVIIAAMPTALNTFIIAGGMGLDERYACEIVAVTTVLAPITIPIWIYLLGI